MRKLFIFIFIIFCFNAFAKENLSKNNITNHFNSFAVKGNFGKNSANLYTNEMFIFPKNIKEDTYFGPNNSFLIHKTINQLDDKSILYSHSLVMLDELGRRGVSKSCSAVYKKLDNNKYEYSGIVFCIPNEVSRVVYKNKFFTIESDKNLSASGYTTEYITFKFKFINHEESVFIESINLKYLNENSITNLGNKGTYSNLFSYTIETNIESSLSDSKINIEVLSGEENIQFLYTDDEITGLKTINSGNVILKITSAYETSINYVTPIEKIYDLQIIDNPNYVKLITNNKTYFNEEIPSSLTLNKGETINLKLEVYNKTALNSKTYLNLLDDNSLISVKNNDSSISYNTTSNSITGIRKVDEIPIVTISSNLYPSIQYDFEINVNYIEIDKESFKFNFTLDEAPNDYNKPKNNDFSKVAIGTIFTINPIINTDATNKELGYISSNNSILQVNYYTGLCTALEPGKVKLTAISISDPSIKFDTLLLHIVNCIFLITVSVSIFHSG